MTNPDDNAYPSKYNSDGMTKREHMVTQVLAAMASNPERVGFSAFVMASRAVELVDKAIERMNGEQEGA